MGSKSIDSAANCLTSSPDHPLGMAGKTGEDAVFTEKTGDLAQFPAFWPLSNRGGLVYFRVPFLNGLAVPSGPIPFNRTRKSIDQVHPWHAYVKSVVNELKRVMLSRLAGKPNTWGGSEPRSPGSRAANFGPTCSEFVWRLPKAGPNR